MFTRDSRGPSSGVSKGVALHGCRAVQLEFALLLYFAGEAARALDALRAYLDLGLERGGGAADGAAEELEVFAAKLRLMHREHVLTE